METLNENLLKQNLADNGNKKVSAALCDDTMLQFFKTKTNLYYFIKNKMKVYELSQWLISFKNYLERKNGSHSFTFVTAEELIIDFGFAYGNELAYKHHAIVIAQKNEKLFVLPLSSSKNAYFPNKKLKPEYAIGNIAEGFGKDGIVLLLNDVRWISVNRIVDSTHRRIDNIYFEEIKRMLLQRSLGTIHSNLQQVESKVKRLDKTIAHKNMIIKKQDDKITTYETSILELKSQLEALIDIDSLESTKCFN